jgi:flagellar hook-associated protein 2
MASTISTNSTGAITNTGVGSGIPTETIVTALVNAEIAPKQSQITKQQTSATTQLSAVGTIKSALDTFRSAIAKLNTESTFNGLTGSSSNTAAASVTADTGAASGSYSLAISQLATSSKISSTVFEGGSTSSVNTSSASQTLSITQSETNYDVTIAPGATMQEVRDNINTQLKAQGITANILTDSNGSRLVLTSQKTGAGTDITMSGTSELATGYTVVGGAAQDAKYSIDGIEMESSSNTVTSAISGVTLKLTAATEDGKPSTITVGTSADTLKSSVNSFISAYNALITAINGQTKTSTTGDTVTAATLTGDSTMRSLVSAVRNELITTTGSGAMSMLSQMGINTVQTTGLLELDDTKWNKAVTSSAADIAKVFTDKNGLVARMTAATDAYAGTGGILSSRVTNLNDKLSQLTESQATLDRRTTSLTATLTAKYTAMDTLVAQLNATSDSIMTTLNALNNSDDD